MELYSEKKDMIEHMYRPINEEVGNFLLYNSCNK